MRRPGRSATVRTGPFGCATSSGIVGGRDVAHVRLSSDAHPPGLRCRESARMWRALSVVVLIELPVGGGVADLASHTVDDSARGMVNHSAERAGWVMENPPRDASALRLVQRVVGRGGAAGSTVEALEFDGTGFDGHAVLRISATAQGDEWHGDATSVQCYRY